MGWIPFGNFEIAIVKAGTLRLDGGAMFGVVPKVLWERSNPPDDRNRILLGTNCLAIRTPDAICLVDTGCGTKWDDRGRDMFDIRTAEGGIVGAFKRETGLDADDVDILIQTHLHFDHAGGSTVRTPDGGLRPAFPDARVVVHEENWEEATHPIELNRASYLPENHRPLEEAGLVERVEGDRTEFLPGIHLERTGGHAAGHMALILESEGAKAVYFGDVVPTWSHVRPPFIMGYDLYPTETLREKKRLMDRAIDEGMIGISEHDPVHPFGRLGRDDRGRYAVERFETWPGQE